jgi:hypothetical protein
MVAGLDLFSEHFERYKDHYVLIGGGACDRQMELKGITFRATKDLDIILIVEALTDEFVNHFWQFIRNGEYTIAEVDSKKAFYRFVNPQASGYPKMIELFSRKPDLIKVVEGIHLTDIPTGDEVSSLSAILLDDDYYNFTLANTVLSNGLHHANEIALIGLKAKAFLNNRARKLQGQQVREDDIAKHKRDVIRLVVTIIPDTKVKPPEAIRNDLRQYIEIMKEEKLDVRQLLKSNVTLDQIIAQLQSTFSL